MADPHDLGSIEIVPYDPRWPDAYRAEEAQLLKLANGRFIHIEHFGSTAIPGSSAKPIIDIIAAARSLEVLDGLLSQLETFGYRELSDNFSYRRFFRKEMVDGPSFHLHVIPESAWKHKSERLFRDWLIAHPAETEAYARLKTTLATRFGSDRETYTDAKGEFIRDVVSNARQSLGLEPIVDWSE